MGRDRIDNDRQRDRQTDLHCTVLHLSIAFKTIKT